MLTPDVPASPAFPRPATSGTAIAGTPRGATVSVPRHDVSTIHSAPRAHGRVLLPRGPALHITAPWGSASSAAPPPPPHVAVATLSEHFDVSVLGEHSDFSALAREELLAFLRLRGSTPDASVNRPQLIAQARKTALLGSSTLESLTHPVFEAEDMATYAQPPVYTTRAGTAARALRVLQGSVTGAATSTLWEFALEMKKQLCSSMDSCPPTALAALVRLDEDAAATRLWPVVGHRIAPALRRKGVSPGAAASDRRRSSMPAVLSGGRPVNLSSRVRRSTSFRPRTQRNAMRTVTGISSVTGRPPTLELRTHIGRGSRTLVCLLGALKRLSDRSKQPAFVGAGVLCRRLMAHAAEECTSAIEELGATAVSARLVARRARPPPLISVGCAAIYRDPPRSCPRRPLCAPRFCTCVAGVSLATPALKCSCRSLGGPSFRLRCKPPLAIGLRYRFRRIAPSDCTHRGRRCNKLLDDDAMHGQQCVTSTRPDVE